MKEQKRVAEELHSANFKHMMSEMTAEGRVFMRRVACHEGRMPSRSGDRPGGARARRVRPVEHHASGVEYMPRNATGVEELQHDTTRWFTSGSTWTMRTQLHGTSQGVERTSLLTRQLELVPYPTERRWTICDMARSCGTRDAPEQVKEKTTATNSL